MPMPPCPFPPSTLAPSPAELDWLYDWLVKEEEIGTADSVLEFGCGITTHCMLSAMTKCAIDSFEEYEPCIDDVLANYANRVRIYNGWAELKDEAGWPYCMVFVDSSAGCGKPGLHRDEAIRAAEPRMFPRAFVIIHDWRKRSGKAARNYLETCGKYQLIDAFMGRTGLGIYRRI